MVDGPPEWVINISIFWQKPSLLQPIVVKNRQNAGKDDNQERIFDLDAEQDQHETGNEQQIMQQEQENPLPSRPIAKTGILAKEIWHNGENKVDDQVQEKQLGQALVKEIHFAARSQKRPNRTERENLEGSHDS